MMASRRLMHPRPKQLRRWLEGDVVPRVDTHIATCTRCADQLESMDETSELSSVRNALLSVLQPPAELPDRLQQRIDERLSEQRDWALIGEFFGLPFQTVQVMTTTDRGDT